jgi:hypothetical protein
MSFILLSLAPGMQNQMTRMVRVLGGADITDYNSTTPTRERFGQPNQFPSVSFTLNGTIPST